VVSLLLLRRNAGCQIPSYDHGRQPAVVQLPRNAGWTRRRATAAPAGLVV